MYIAQAAEERGMLVAAQGIDKTTWFASFNGAVPKGTVPDGMNNC